MKTTTQLFCRLLSVLIMHLIMCGPLRAQTVATPTLYTTIASGSQTVMAASLSGADHWFRWVSDTGLVKVDVKLTEQGTSYQNVTAEIYLKLSVDSVYRVYVDSLHSDSTIHLAAGYVSELDTVFIRFVHTAGSCGSCTYASPVVDFTIYSTLSGCTPNVNCSMVRNGGFEQINIGAACGGLDITDGVDCWYPFENSTDVYRRNCSAYFNSCNLGVSTQNTSPPLDAHSPNPNNTIAGQYCRLSPSHLAYEAYNESIQSLLTTPLLSGHTYSLSCWLYNYSGQISTSNTANPMGHPAIVTFGTSAGIIASASPNPGLYSSYPVNPSINLLTSFVVSPINTWTQYTYTFTYSGPSNSNLLVGPNISANEANGNINRTDNVTLYIALDDIEIREITTLSATSATICAGQTTTLTASGMSNYTWQPGNTNGASIPANPIVTTVYTVTGTDGGGCTKVQTATVTVNPLPNIVVATPSVGICPGSSVTLGATGAASYTWAPCSSGCNLNSLVVSPSVNTTYTVTGLASGCTNTATAFVYILNANNSINVSGYTTICQGESAFLSATGATGYTWSPCVTGCNGATLAPTPSVTTTYTVRGVNPCGVLSTSTVVVTVKPTWPVDPAVLSNPVCSGYSVSVIANGGSPYSYTWTPGNIVGTMITVTPSVTTTYTACTSVPGCSTVCAAVTVTVFPVPQLTLTPSSFTTCPGTSTTISVSGATSYTWSTGATGPSITVAPTTNTVYSVTGYTATCPPITATTTAYVYPSLTVTAAPNVTTCPGANTALTVAGGSGSYTWSPGGATTASIVVSPTVPTVYTVTSSDAACNMTATALVNPITCCSVTTAVTFTATSGLITGGTYNLNGPLVLTGNLTIDQAVIFMGTNAEILVPNNVRLVIGASHLLGCPQMWKGIRCTGSTGGVEISKNTLIEDAITAIDVSNVTGPQSSGSPHILYLEDATFNKNYTAVKVETYNTASADYPVLMVNTVFTSRKLITPEHQLVNPSLSLTYNWPTDDNTNLKGFATMPNLFTPDLHLLTSDIFSVASYSTSNMEVPNSNSVAHQGIRLKDVYSTSNHNAFRMTGNEPVPYAYDGFNRYNVFDNMHYGVNAENSNLMVAHAAFQNMSQFVTGTAPGSPNLKYYDGGMGINSISTLSSGLSTAQTFSLAVGPVINGTNKSTNFFINNPYGIKTENIAYMNVGYNIFHSNRTYSAFTAGQFNAPVARGDYAIYIKTLDYRIINIRRNVTANIANGIIFIANANHVSGKLYAQYAGTVNIASNTLKANYGSSITASQSLKQAIATDNLMSGIALLSTTNPPTPVYINNNTIDKAFNGITVSNWNRQRVIDNSNVITLVNEGSVSTNQYGIKHINNMGDNIIGNNVKGFNTTKQRVYGIMASENKAQSFWCNFTENSYIGTVFIGSQNLTKWKNNTMTTHQQAMRLDNTTIGTQGAMSQPINNTWSGSWTGAFKTYVNGVDPGTPAGNSKMYLSNVPSISENGAVPSTFRYKTTIPQSLFYTTGSSGVSCPYTLPTPPEAPQFSGFQENLDYMVLDSLNYGTYLTGNRKNSKLAVYRALLEDTTLLATDTILQNFKAASDTGNIGKLFAVEQYLVDGDYASADALLASITPLDSVEYGLKKVYKIYVRTKSDTYDAGDESDLIELANSCPAQMGIGVYQARVLLNSIYDVYFEYESDCGDTNNVAYRKARGSEEVTSSVPSGNFMVYPNPSNGAVYFTAANMGIETYTVTVYDISGKAIFIKEFTDGEKVNAIDLNLSNGVYLMQLTDQKNDEIYKQKFVIQK